MKNRSFILQIGLIVLGMLFYFVANFQRIAVPGAIFDILEQELSVGAPQITAFGALFMYVYANSPARFKASSICAQKFSSPTSFTNPSFFITFIGCSFTWENIIFMPFF